MKIVRRRKAIFNLSDNLNLRRHRDIIIYYENESGQYYIRGKSEEI
jgi:hypothetical protein